MPYASYLLALYEYFLMAENRLDGKTWSVDQSQEQGNTLSEKVLEFFSGITIFK